MPSPLSDDFMSKEPDPCVRCGAPVANWGNEYCPLCLGIVLGQIVLITPPARHDDGLRPVPVWML